MIPQELLGTAKIPGGPGEMELYRHDADFSFRVRGKELMTSREHGSEELLAELPIERFPEHARAEARVLVGGLGMGFTLAKVLELVGPKSRIKVVELVAEVITWNREYLGGLTSDPLEDPRVEVLHGDVVKQIRLADAEYDLILLDVDNGPEGLTRDANDRLYDRNGLIDARNALRSGGILAIWSSANNPSFTARIQRAGFRVSEERVLARRTKGARRTIWVSERVEKPSKNRRRR